MNREVIRTLFHLGQCMVWTAEATTGAVQRKKVMVGYETSPDQREMTPDEKTDYALSIARNHLEIIAEIMNYIDKESS